MSNTVQYNWKLFCETEGAFKIVENQKHRPTECPTDSGHTIDPDQSSYELVETKSNIINTSRELGFYVCKGFVFDMPANTTTIHDTSFDHDLFLQLGRVFCEAENAGDTFSVHIGPGLAVGVLTQNASIGDTVLHVNSTAIDNVEKGMFFTLDQDYNVAGFNLYDSTITIDKPLTSNYLAGQLLTVTVLLIDNITIPTTPQTFHIGSKVLNPSYLSAGRVVRLVYTNNSLLTAKKLNVVIDFF